MRLGLSQFSDRMFANSYLLGQMLYAVNYIYIYIYTVKIYYICTSIKKCRVGKIKMFLKGSLFYTRLHLFDQNIVQF